MRLINVRTLAMGEFIGKQTPKYAILSHRWEEEEVSFTNFQNETSRNRLKGWTKIEKACAVVREWPDMTIDWLWCDACCIDKSSSAELSEAINSMWKWYQRSEFCLAYLCDVQLPREDGDFQDSNWFTRGWTLQELIAPHDVYFYTQSWECIGTRHDLQSTIMQVTGISDFDISIIKGQSIAQRMFWASKRETTREEDAAYCMMGLFGVNMALLYGEGGENAFLRLQKKIMAQTDDESIFAWKSTNDSIGGILARSPQAFQHSDGVQCTKGSVWSPEATSVALWFGKLRASEHALTNRGMKIKLQLFEYRSYPKNPSLREMVLPLYMAPLRCFRQLGPTGPPLLICIYLVTLGEDGAFRVGSWDLAALPCFNGLFKERLKKTVYIPQNLEMDAAHEGNVEIRSGEHRVKGKDNKDLFPMRLDGCNVDVVLSSTYTQYLPKGGSYHRIHR